MTETGSIIKKYLFYMFRDAKLSTGIHLDGGAALYFFYEINRIFSNDLDFTAERKSQLSNFINNSLIPLQKVNHGNAKWNLKKIIDTNKIIICINGSQIFHIDIYYVPPKYCHYQVDNLTLNNESADISLHSLNDIFVEKLLCTITRTETRDLIDLSEIIFRKNLNSEKVIQMYQLKSGFKNLNIRNLKKYLFSISSIESRFYLKFPSMRRDIENQFKVMRKFIEQSIMFKFR